MIPYRYSSATLMQEHDTDTAMEEEKERALFLFVRVRLFSSPVCDLIILTE